ncbi:MAG TPA: CsbD family protein [Gaiellaceae bacterium]
MSFLDKLLGRGKKAAGDLTDDSEMRREGMHQEAEGMAESRADSAEEMAQEAREDASEHRAERNDPM